ncbi:MAG: hypothetical protein LCH61_09630 [Proteobacteria bacterium]|nr:hypothetical protein [Pseudomonadota bacterium]
MTHVLVWTTEPHRRVAYCGAIAIGAVFPPRGGGRQWRWRSWVNVCINPVDGHAPSEEAAKDEVAARFWRFVSQAGLIQIERGYAEGRQ